MLSPSLALASITTEANRADVLCTTVCPSFLHPRDYGRWLHPGEPGSAEGPRPQPASHRSIAPLRGRCYENGAGEPEVGNVRNNGPEMLNSA